MRFVLNGESTDVDIATLRVSELFSSLSVQETIGIKKHGYGLASFSQALKEMDPEAVLLAAWVGLRRQGHTVTPEQMDFDLIEFCTELATDLGDKPDEKSEGEPEADPTKRSASSLLGKTP